METFREGRSDLQNKLEAYLEVAKEEPTVWGKSDCTAWPRTWVEQVRGAPIDLPEWSSREEALALIEASGSLEALWSTELERYGLKERWADALDPPHLGDVGIIQTHMFPQVGGIFCAHGLFVWRAEPFGYRMLMPKPKYIVKVWALI